MSVEEQRLIARAVCGEPGAFSELYLKYHPAVLKYTYSLVGNRQEAEDVSAETFLRAWKAVEHFDDRGYSILPWLLKIAHNHVIKNAKRRPRTADVDELADFLVDEDPKKSPELVAELNLSSCSLRQALLALPMNQRQVVMLRFLEELSHDEVKRIVGKSNGAIRVMQHRALRTLQNLMSEQEFEWVQRRLTPGETGRRRRLQPATIAAGKGGWL